MLQLTTQYLRMFQMSDNYSLGKLPLFFVALVQCG